MNERVAALLALGSVRAALEEGDLVDVLGDVVPMSEDYIPVLQFLMRPDNLVALVASLLEEPSTPKRPVEPGQTPTYDEYAVVYRAHWIFCASGFSMQLIAAMIALKDEPRRAIRALLLQFDSRDTMVLEAFTRFLTTFMDQYSSDVLLAFFEPGEQVAFVQTLLVLVVYEPVRDVLLRVCNEVGDDKLDVRPLLGVLLLQLSPDGRLASDAAVDAAVASPTARERAARDQPHERFSRMVFSCDLLTDLIHEGRPGSLGFALVHELATSELFGRALLDAALFDLSALPTAFANESYALKVLNSLLQQTQCGCVSRASESDGESANGGGSEAAPALPSSDGGDGGDGSDAPGALPAPRTEGPHESLPTLWKIFLSRLSEVLAFLSVPAHTHFKPTHVQLAYLMLPVLNVACREADRRVVQARAMEALLALLPRFPAASILHCAVSRLFIVALEDSPFMFGKELPAFRAADDPLRAHLLLDGALKSVLDAYAAGREARCVPPAFLDVAISFDQAVTSACSARVFDTHAALLDRWRAFRAGVLLPTQAVWEEQYQLAAGVGVGVGDVAASAPEQPPAESSQAQTSTLQLAGGDRDTREMEPSSAREAARAAGPPVAVVAVVAAAVDADADADANADVPTPLSALYSDEENRLMLRVATTGDA